MLFDFDSVIERKNTDSVKYDMAIRTGRPADVLPLWVADMDFAAPPCVEQALIARAKHGVYGYSVAGKGYFSAVRDWLKLRHGYEVQESWLVKTPGVVHAIATAIRALTAKGDSVLVQQPVYHPFANSVNDNERKLVVNPLIQNDEKYEIDFVDFEKKIVDENVRLFILCNPHNPVGRVYTADELTRMGDICLAHNVLVVSDEIHMDFIYPGHRHIPFASLKPAYENITVTCTAPSKTFNLAALQAANIFITNDDIREKFKAEMRQTGYDAPNVMGLLSCEAAYRDGGPWLDALLEYLQANLGFIREFLSEKLPRVKLIEPEGTYLVWLDFSDYGLDDQELNELLTHKAKVWFNAGTIFGQGGSGFQRVNIACRRSTLMEAMERVEKAFK